ncbi:hypothetical protein B0X71_12720 [Planococcus lenghuensis]|uniref:Uncharacterized protein n=1 Tax=Planococcus lenghuensis TaxID=2213202 RepID=A0A1Q2L094_9BACL|nr:hypothetical protein B0X71_12720 [Planococcus lenghuensis]
MNCRRGILLLNTATFSFPPFVAGPTDGLAFFYGLRSKSVHPFLTSAVEPNDFPRAYRKAVSSFMKNRFFHRCLLFEMNVQRRFGKMEVNREG